MSLELARPVTGQSRPLATSKRPLTSLFSRSENDAGISKGVKSKLLRALIVDDEPVARRVLREELELQPDIEIIGEADTGERALKRSPLSSRIWSSWTCKCPKWGIRGHTAATRWNSSSRHHCRDGL